MDSIWRRCEDCKHAKETIPEQKHYVYCKVLHVEVQAKGAPQMLGCWSQKQEDSFDAS